MTYEYYCKCCGCLWTSTHSSQRCPDCNSSEFDCGDFPEDYEESRDYEESEDNEDNEEA